MKQLTGELPALRLQDVRYSYPDSVEALGGVSFEVEAGSITSVVGPSGCGKSTLLSLIAALLRPTAGSIERDEDQEGGRHPVSMVFQKDTLLPWLTVEENANLAFRFRGNRPENKTAHRAWIADLLATAKLTDFSHAYPHQLSGGMRRRLAFVAAVAPRPRLLLLDEPFSSVDEPTRIAIHQDVLRIVKEARISTVIVTHDLAEAISLSDRLVMLTNRPARVASVHDLTFGPERNVLQLRESQQYLARYGELWALLSREIAASDNRDGERIAR